MSYRHSSPRVWVWIRDRGSGQTRKAFPRRCDRSLCLGDIPLYTSSRTPSMHLFPWPSICWEGNYLQRKAATRLPGCGLTCMEFRHHLSCPHKRKAEQRESSNSSMQQRTEVMGQTVPQKTEETGAYRASQVPGTWVATPTPQQ